MILVPLTIITDVLNNILKFQTDWSSSVFEIYANQKDEFEKNAFKVFF